MDIELQQKFEYVNMTNTRWRTRKTSQITPAYLHLNYDGQGGGRLLDHIHSFKGKTRL